MYICAWLVACRRGARRAFAWEPDARRLPFGRRVRSALGACRGVALNYFQISFAQKKFKRAKLPTLKSTGVGQETSKCQERNRRHSFQHINLRHHGLENLQHARQRGRCLLHATLRQQFAQMFALMNLLLEPQFIHLMNDDE